ncbi:MAG: phosphatidylglycerophosphatase A [Acidobacteria bacterium]|nr:phosphatidylglycerophosphatase A [Acidobacteriota bacterium]MBI3264735.1 phosphatidylglycerophosphatase A [Acidobacteriota bacterium]
MTRVAILVCTFGYIGFFPIAPGTVGSMAGLVVYWILHVAGQDQLLPAMVGVLLVAGVWSGTIAERHFGAIDPGPIVIDEVAGMLITLAFVPAGWSVAGVGFLVFRLFDIIKPFPSARLERLPGGAGIMADDAMAAVYANLVVRVFAWLGSAWGW